MADPESRSKRNAATVDSINEASEKARQYAPRNLDDAPQRGIAARNLDVPSSSGVYTKEVAPRFNKGGIVGPNVLKWGSPKVSAPCKDSKTIKCY